MYFEYLLLFLPLILNLLNCHVPKKKALILLSSKVFVQTLEQKYILKSILAFIYIPKKAENIQKYLEKRRQYMYSKLKKNLGSQVYFDLFEKIYKQVFICITQRENSSNTSNGSASKHLVLLGNPSTYMCDEGVISLDAIFCKIENDMKCIVVVVRHIQYTYIFLKVVYIGMYLLENVRAQSLKKFSHYFSGRRCLRVDSS